MFFTLNRLMHQSSKFKLFNIKIQLPVKLKKQTGMLHLHINTHIHTNIHYSSLLKKHLLLYYLYNYLLNTQHILTIMPKLYF